MSSARHSTPGTIFSRSTKKKSPKRKNSRDKLRKLCEGARFPCGPHTDTKKKMHSVEEKYLNVFETAERLSDLSIIVDDFDSGRNVANKVEGNVPEVVVYQAVQKPCTRQSSDANIKKILEEAEHRKHEFWKLIDEHDAVVANLKKMEQMETNGTLFKSIKT